MTDAAARETDEPVASGQAETTNGDSNEKKNIRIDAQEQAVETKMSGQSQRAEEEKTEADQEDQEEEEESDSDDEDSAVLGIRERRIKHWEESPFAVGNVNVTWAEDRENCCGKRNSNVNGQVCCSAFVCGCLGADRVGNMAVLAQSTQVYNHIQVNEETGERTTTRKTRPKLLWVVGPYWPVNLFLTYPLILGVSFLVGWRTVRYSSAPIIITWSICTFSLIFSLAMVACRDPGILYRHLQRPLNADTWRWNDQSRTFRPPRARFDPECQVVVEGFDHT